MDRWEWTKVGAAVGAALLVMFAGSWFSGQVIGVNYPERHGYAVEGVAPVDLAIQFALSHPFVHSALIGFGENSQIDTALRALDGLPSRINWDDVLTELDKAQ